MPYEHYVFRRKTALFSDHFSDFRLIAQAKAEEIVLLTHDSLSQYYNEGCVHLA